MFNLCKKSKIFSIVSIFIFLFLIISSVSGSDDFNSVANLDDEGLDNGINENIIVNNNLNEIYVSVEGDDVNGDGSFYNPYKTIQNSVSKSINGTKIYINPGEYSGEYNTNIIIDNDLIIMKNPNMIGDVIVNGNNNSRLFDVSSSSNLILDDLTLINGHKLGIGTEIFPGGAIINEGNLSIINCIIKDCDGYTKGGAIYSKGPLTIINSSFIHNNASKSGGAILCTGYLKVENSLFKDNYIISTSFSEAGGAISSAFGGYIINSEFINNSAGASGAVSSSGSMLIDNCTFINNIGNYCVGAITNNGKLIINNSYMGYNYAQFYAGVLLATRAATSTEIYNSIMEYNHVGMFASSINCYTTGTIIQQCVFRYNYVDGNITKGEINTDYYLDASYNWWGKNKIGYYIAEGSQFVNGSINLIMSFNSSKLYTGELSYLTVDLKHYFDNETKTIKEYGNDVYLPLKVQFYTNKCEILNATLVNGTVTIKYTPTEGVNKVYAKIDDQILSLDVNKRIYTTITATSKSIATKTSNYFIITLKANNKVLANKNVKIIINNKVYNVKTNSKGQASVKISFKNIGIYDVITTYDGDNNFVQKTIKSKIIVKKKTSIISSPIKVKAKKSKYFTFALKDIDKKVLKNKKVKITLNGKTYTVTTNSKGQGKIRVKLSKKKTYKAIIKFTNDNYYFGSSKVSYVKVV